jgi:hypothetical protein
MNTKTRRKGRAFVRADRQSTCRYHCRSCGGHFTSLEAFDAHRRSYECVWPNDSGQVEIPNGVCKIADDQALEGVSIYSTERAERARLHFRGENGRESASANAREAVPA